MNQQVVPLPLPPTAAPEAVDLSSNATSWYNITAWTVNVTRYAPSLEDLVWAGPRMFKKLGSYMALAEPLDDGTSTGFFGSLSPNIFNTMGNAAAENADGAQEAASQASRFSLGLDKAGGLASLATYLTSRWALSCIAMALILNRTHIFAATRRKLRLHWHIRLALRLLPIIFLTMQVRRLLMSIQCQTSADFSELRWGNSSMSSDFMFAYNNPFLNTMSSTLLFGATDEQSCTNVRMIPSDLTDGSKQLRGSLSGLWPLFTTYCLSHFIETISCALQGRPLSAETGMTLFEQSLAFAEADSTVNSQLGNLKFSNARPSDSSGATSAAVTTLTRSMVLQRVNTSPEVLLVAFLSSMTHLSSHILGIFDLQSKYRLFNTGFWGMGFMGSIVWGVFTFDIDDTSTHSILRFPTVCIIGFVPHLMVFAGILICLSIYGVALLLSALSPPENEERSSMSFRQRIVYAHENMQANVSLAEVRLTRDMDFYTALLRTGFAAITMASEAVYLNEDRGVSLRRHTWLDESRYREAEELQRQWVAIGPSGTRYDQVGAVGLIPIKEGPVDAPNGFARERAAQEVIKFRGGKNPRSGVGAAERSSRWLMATDFFMSIARLVFRIWATMVLGFLRVVRISRQPAWLLWMAQRPKYSGDDSRQQPRPVSRWPRRRGRFMNRDSTESGSEGMDVEAEFRRVGRGQSESKLDKDLYHYFLEGGWWGSGDASGDYQPDASDDDWDVTSVVTTTTAADETDIETGDETDNGWESEDPGQRTPTQTTPRMSRGGTPVADSPMGMTDLARLLRPANKEERDEAATLAAHLVNDGIMTRAGYKRLEQLRRTRVLGTPIRPNAFATAAPSNTDRPLRLSPEAEENLLEQILLSKRQEGAAAAAAGPSTPTASTSHNALAQGRNFGPASPGAADDDQPPQCVVCQCMPRTIIVWPCRCLSLCDDCRVSLAMNNFDKCVCCRREVLSFSRIFMP